MKSPHKIGIPPGVRVLHIERHEEQWIEHPTEDAAYKQVAHYRLWIHRNVSDRLLGTYLALWDNGKIERITVRANEGDQVDLIKPED